MIDPAPAFPEAKAEELPSRPYLKPWLRIASTDAAVVFEYAQAAVALEGRAAGRFLTALLPLLDGNRPIEEISTAFGDDNVTAVRNALSVLDANGLLTNGPPLTARGGFSESARFLAATAPDITSPHECAEAINTKRIAVVGGGPLADEIERLARETGFPSERVRTDDFDGTQEADLLIAAPAWEERTLPQRVNEAALDRGAHWMFVGGFDGRMAPVGPLFIPHETCCYECYTIRIRTNLEYREHVDALDAAAAPFPETPAMNSIISGLALTFAARWLSWRDPFLPGMFYAYEYSTIWDLTPHRVYRVPRCPSCASTKDLSMLLPWAESEHR